MALMERGLVEDHLLPLVVVYLLFIIPIVSTAEYVGELLVISMEVQRHLITMQLEQLIHTMSMELVLHMVYLGITSGPLQLVCLREGIPQIRDGTALAAILAILVMYFHLHLLEKTTTVSQAIQQANIRLIICTLLTHSGMASSVKASVAVMENLLHGSVWSYQTQQLMILRSVYVYLKAEVLMML